MTPEAAENVKRIEAMWECRVIRPEDRRAVLFGRFGAADAMYAPVVARLHAYDDVGGTARAISCRHGFSGLQSGMPRSRRPKCWRR